MPEGPNPVATDLLLAAIQKLYRIERQAKERKLAPQALRELRQTEARSLFEELGALVDAYAQHVLPQSPLGRALS